jgi:DNA-binding NtrC family response regulator
MAHVLIVEDQDNVRGSMAILLARAGHIVTEASDVPAALDALAASPCEVVLTDVRMQGDADGASLLRAVKTRDAEVEVVMMTAFGSIEDAVQAIRGGAYDYLTKPVEPDRLLLTVRRAAERCALAREVKQLRAQMSGGDEIVAASPAMQAVLARVAQLAQTDSTVLITGESGTGKELIARALYEQSARRQGRFVPINCGAISETILESELFGHRRGAFTGAVSDKKGLLEEAHNGVLFLDEIGEMSTSMQVRLLRFLQGGEVRRVGETETRRVNVRLVAATHRALEDEVAAGRFRQDFYYRINVVGVSVPPLRERPEDIVALTTAFLPRIAARLKRPVRGFSSGTLDLMARYHWPGNVRELENAIERALNVASGELITEEDLPAALTLSPVPVSAAPPEAEDQRARLVAALEQSRWNQGRAAASLGISRTTLWRKLREHGIRS